MKRFTSVMLVVFLIAMAASASFSTAPAPFAVVCAGQGGVEYVSFNSATGNYVYEKCSPFVRLTGTGSVNMLGHFLVLNHQTATRDVVVVVDTSDNTGEAHVEDTVAGVNVDISDSDTTQPCGCFSKNQ
ncbi:MAG: hypothetical protein L0229_20210 [Blastocatellia bacterium]|nr:hypothetical protein [Blastocatellia bacterium]